MAHTPSVQFVNFSQFNRPSMNWMQFCLFWLDNFEKIRTKLMLHWLVTRQYKPLKIVSAIYTKIQTQMMLSASVVSEQSVHMCKLNNFTRPSMPNLLPEHIERWTSTCHKHTFFIILNSSAMNQHVWFVYLQAKFFVDIVQSVDFEYVWRTLNLFEIL